MTLTLFGLGLSPLIVAALLHVVPWRFIFSIFVIPGLLLAWYTWRIVPAQGPDAADSGAAASVTGHGCWVTGTCAS